MPIRLTELIEKVPPEVENRVKKTLSHAKPILQEMLRRECRLTMRKGESDEEDRKNVQVPVEVAPGHPVILEDVTFPDDLERILLLGRERAALESARASADALIPLRAKLAQRSAPDQWTGATEAEIRSVRDWADTLLNRLDESDPIKAVLAVSEDCLGVYSFDISALFADEYAINGARIRLYWGVIGLCAEWMGCTVEDLTVVVLTHELAHAYTQLGADIDGRRWPATVFNRVEMGLAEGLAQYYTDRVLNRVQKQHPAALGVFLKMQPQQPEPYRAHQPWLTAYSPEAVRRAMLEVRYWKELKLSDFNRRLNKAQQELHP